MFDSLDARTRRQRDCRLIARYYIFFVIMNNAGNDFFGPTGFL
jgi:hypothetical protein